MNQGKLFHPTVVKHPTQCNVDQNLCILGGSLPTDWFRTSALRFKNCEVLGCV
jgi:hypothetical protein